MHVLKPLGAAALTFAVIAGVAQSAPAGAAPPSDVFLTGVVENATATVTQGVVDAKTARNVKAAGGASVSLSYIDSSNAKVGDELFPVVLASTKTDSSGRYTLRLKPSAALKQQIAKNDNYLNVDLAVTTADGSTQEAISGYWNGVGWGNKERPETSPTRQHRTMLATDPATGATNGVRAAKQSGAKGGASASPALAAGTVPCSFIITGNPTKYTKVAELHGTTATRSTWTYGRTADSDIDAAIDYDGNGGWSISGSAHIGTSNSSSTGASTIHTLTGYYATSNFQYREGYYKPYGTYSGYTLCSGTGVTPNTKSLKANSWLGGASTNANLSQYDCYDAPQSSYRVVQSVNSFFNTSSARAQKYSGSAVFSYVSLGATSGFSTYVDLGFKWDNGRSGYLCGNNAYPTSAKILYVN
jgi:hypothetical protein